MQEQEDKHQKWCYDCKMRSTKLELVDHILLQQKCFQAKHKIADQWKNTTYEIAEKLNDAPIYKICELPKPGGNMMSPIHCTP